MGSVVSNIEKNATERMPPPYPLAMVVCDNIHRDPATGKPYLLGCFSVIHAAEFPAVHRGMALYVSVTNGRGVVPYKIQLVDANEEREPIWSVEDQLEFSDPRLVMEMCFYLVNVRFDEPGEYRFQLFASDEFLMERRVLITEVDVQ